MTSLRFEIIIAVIVGSLLLFGIAILVSEEKLEKEAQIEREAE